MPHQRPQISVFNLSTVLTDPEIEPVVHAIQAQVNEDFQPEWGRGAHLIQVPSGQQPDEEHWWCGIFDDSDVANALGYHDLTPKGYPLSKVFAKTDLQYGLQWSVTMSHEVLEMLGDPTINLTAQVSNTELYAYENCDAVESDELGYQKNGVHVSDFVTPAWFMPGYPGPFDFQGHVNEALELAPGGYISVLDLGSGAGWTQKYGRMASRRPPSGSVPKVGSRRERRGRSHDLWRMSDPENHLDARKIVFGDDSR
jgi:hypothetical protein